MDAIHTIEKDNCTIEIYPDENPWNPREWDNLGTMVCFHPRYNLGDDCTKFVQGKPYFRDADMLIEYLKTAKVVMLPLYLYDHSGITMSTSNRQYPFNDVWDSGQVGIIYVTYETIKKEYGWRKMTRERIKKIQDYLRGEIKTYDQYLTGDVYGYNVTCNQCGEMIDSCWGFYGSNWKENGLLDQAETTCNVCKETEKRLDMIFA